MTHQDKAYAELLLAWARTIHVHRLSFEEYEERYGPTTDWLQDFDPQKLDPMFGGPRVTIHHAEGRK